MPIKLEGFSVRSNSSCAATVFWKSGTEANVKIIEVLRSDDGITFNKVASVNPKGSNSSYEIEKNNYNDAFFKLKIIDLDGHYEFSEILSCKSRCSEIGYTLMPNPAQDYVQVKGLKNKIG